MSTLAPDYNTNAMKLSARDIAMFDEETRQWFPEGYRTCCNLCKNCYTLDGTDIGFCIDSLDWVYSFEPIMNTSCPAYDEKEI